jgi:hypothetical protein
VIPPGKTRGPTAEQVALSLVGPLPRDASASKAGAARIRAAIQDVEDPELREALRAACTHVRLATDEDAERGGRWITAPDLARVYAGRYPDSLSAQASLRNARLLVVDDVGRESQTADPDKARASMGFALLELLDARQSSETRTIVTSNMGRDLLLRTFSDPRLRSRLGQIAQVFECPGDDLRSKT